jgi:hypothetical protein
MPAGGGACQIGNQLVRSGISPYLHHREVEAAKALNDFVHKLKVGSWILDVNPEGRP